MSAEDFKMKKIMGRKIAALLMAAFFISAVSAKEKAPYRVSVQNIEAEGSIKPDKYNRQLGYQITDEGKSLQFVFVPSVWKIEKPLEVYVEGSFNGWAKKSPDWELKKIKNQLWTLECPVEDIKIPGNSGFPEFKFIVIGEVEYIESVCGKDITRTKKQTFEPNAVSRIPGYQMASNNLILFPEDNPEDVIKNVELSKTVKKLKEYNLEEEADRERIANFRKVPGTTSLYRGYHPYKISRGHLDTEKPRINAVNQLLKEKGVQSIITLSGNEQIDSKNESISVYVMDIRQNGNQFFVNTHYNTVYYKSASREFGEMMGDIVRFIDTHPAPYYVHCRLGTDRTGVISAVLAALSGASWEEIAADYQKTNELGIQEVRDWRLLKYSFEKMLGKPMEEVTDLQKELSTFFIENKFFSSADFEALKKKLSE